ncbi:MAG: PilZ domain-containing protein [Actinomycetota bacterium]|nr:PilZ domain-containing protein [Actinomycetota bacterium]
MGKKGKEENLIDWLSLKRVLKPGTQMDIQFDESDSPVPYVVLMTFDTPLVVCRIADGVKAPKVEEGSSPMIYMPASRDFCSFKAIVKQCAEGGAYLAISPETSAEFLRRRRSIRVKAPAGIAYRVQFEGKSNIYKGVSVQDISRGGIGLLVYAAGLIAEGTKVKIVIELPQLGERVSASGVVSHCVPYGSIPRMYRIGIRFTMISPRDKQTIAMFIDQHEKNVKSVSRLAQ